jgi:long-chain fatty acid transport protein
MMPSANAPRTAHVAFEEEADGIGGVIGINFSPTSELNIGLHYDSKVNLDYKQTVLRDNLGLLPALGIVHNSERNRNLPAVLAAGVSYQIIPKLRVETNLTAYLNKDAGFRDIPQTARDESAVDNGYDIGIGFEYACTDSIKATFGYLYTATGVEAKDMTPELPELDSHSLGAGLRWQMNEKIDFTFGLGHVFYKDASFVSSTTGATITYEKDITFVAFGMQYKFF